MAAIEETVRTHLLTTITTVPIFVGGVRPAKPGIPAAAVFVLETGGPPPQPYMDGDRTPYRFYRVQIWVRGEANSYQTTRDRAHSIQGAMQQTVGMPQFTRVTCDQSSPVYLGRNDQEQEEFVVNVTIEYRG